MISRVTRDNHLFTNRVTSPLVESSVFHASESYGVACKFESRGVAQGVWGLGCLILTLLAKL